MATPPSPESGSNDMNTLVNQFQQQNLNFTLPFQNISNFVSFNLGNTNFLPWRHKFESILMSTNLLRFVDGTYPYHLLTSWSMESVL